MLVYILTFVLSLLGVWIADMWHDDRERFFVGSVLAVLPPIIIAGLRDSIVGTDMEVYIVPVYNSVSSNGQGLMEFFEANDDMEKGYLLLNYVFAQFTDEPFFLLTCIHTLIMVPLYVVAMKWRAQLSPVLFMFVFYMIFYQESLSIVRQSIALSFSMLAFTLFLERKYIYYILYMVLAFLFHQTAVIALSFPIIYFVIDKISVRQAYLFYIGVAVATMLFFLNLDNILISMIEGGLIDLKFLKYTTADNMFTPVLGAANLFVKVTIIAFAAYIMLVYKADTLLKFFLVMAVLDMLFSLCALIVSPLDRLSLYFRLVGCISIPYLIYNYPVLFTDQDKPYNRPVEGIVCVILFVYWFYVYMLGNYDDTADYQISSTLFI